MTLFAEYIPKYHGAGFAIEIVNLQLLCPLHDLWIIRPRLTEAGEVALHVGHKNRHTACAEILRQRLQRDRFPRTCGTGNQTVAVRHFRKQKDLLL